MAKHQISDYEQTAGQQRVCRDGNDGKQAKEPSLHLPLGPFACGIAIRKLVAFREDGNARCQVVTGTDFD